jgi:hypothetical protein
MRPRFDLNASTHSALLHPELFYPGPWRAIQKEPR